MLFLLSGFLLVPLPCRVAKLPSLDSLVSDDCLSPPLPSAPCAVSSWNSGGGGMGFALRGAGTPPGTRLLTSSKSLGRCCTRLLAWLDDFSAASKSSVSVAYARAANTGAGGRVRALRGRQPKGGGGKGRRDDSTARHRSTKKRVVPRLFPHLVKRANAKHCSRVARAPPPSPPPRRREIPAAPPPASSPRARSTRQSTLLLRRRYSPPPRPPSAKVANQFFFAKSYHTKCFTKVQAPQKE